MRTRILTIEFLLILFILAGINIMTDAKAIKAGFGKDNINSAIANVESYFNENFVSKYTFIEANGLTKAMLGNWESNDRIKMEGGYLAQTTEPLYVTDKAANIADLNAYLEDRSIPFLYIAFPNKVEIGRNELRPGKETHSNENVDVLLSGLKEGKVSFFDLRQDMKEDYKDWQSGFFKTDHHWLPQTAFWAYTKIAEKLKNDYGFDYNETTTDIDNYRIKTYKEQFLGSSGRRTGRCYSGLDDFSLIIPRFETNMSLDAPVEDIHRQGSYETVMFDKSYLKKDYYNVDTYNTYTGGYDLCIQKNESAVNDKKLLVIKDSYTLALQPYYSFIFSEVDVIDLRYYEQETLIEYIERTDPDMVIMEYSPGQLGEEELFSFGL